jgi:toxin ParE1/3/4
MARVFVTTRAQADLDAIDRYGLEEFGRSIADRYHEDLLATFELIGETPKIAPVFRKGPPVVRSWSCGRHRRYYRIEAQFVIVIRVLHQSMHHNHIL